MRDRRTVRHESAGVRERGGGAAALVQLPARNRSDRDADREPGGGDGVAAQPGTARPDAGQPFGHRLGQHGVVREAQRIRQPPERLGRPLGLRIRDLVDGRITQAGERDVFRIVCLGPAKVARNGVSDHRKVIVVDELDEGTPTTRFDLEDPTEYEHAFMEFDIDRENETLVERWIYNDGPEWPMYKGMAIKLPNDNVLANYGTGGVIREITPEKETAFHVKFDVDEGDDFFNKMVGHNVLIDDLYALNGGPD